MSRQCGERNRVELSRARVEGRSHFTRFGTRQLWRHPDTGDVVLFDRLTVDERGRAEFVGHEVYATRCAVERYDRAIRDGTKLVLVQAARDTRATCGPRPPEGRAPRLATNARTRGSRRGGGAASSSGDDPGDLGESEPPGRPAGRPCSGLDRWPTTGEFLTALARFWGGRGYRTARDGTVHLGACPACRSKGTHRGEWTAWPLVIAATARLDVFPTCGCPREAIAAALVTAEIAGLELELASLANAADFGAESVRMS